MIWFGAAGGAISSAMQAALDLKAPITDPNFQTAIRLGGVPVSADAEKIRVKKTADSTRASGTTLTAEADLQATLDAGEDWFLCWTWRLEGDTANDGKFDIQGPANAEVSGGQVIAQYIGGAGQVESINVLPSGAYSVATLGGTLVSSVQVWMRVILPTGGTISFRWAKNADTVTGTPLTIRARSWLVGNREA